MDIQLLATKARSSISAFCMTECGAYCCRKGYLILNAAELKLITADKQEELEQKGFIVAQKNNLFSLNLGNHLGSCPRLEGSVCTIHKNPLRPATCEKYPIFVDEEKKEVHFSKRCFAVKQNKLYAYEHQFLKEGYTLN